MPKLDAQTIIIQPLTCFSNDYGYENGLKNLLIFLNRRCGYSNSSVEDLKICLSKSAKNKLSKIITLTEIKNNPLSKLGDVNFGLIAKHNHIENVHQLILFLDFDY